MPLPRDDGPDTALARALHAAGVLPLETLRRCLDEVRAGRSTGLTLAGLLLARGLAPVTALEQAAAGVEAETKVAGPRAAVGGRVEPPQRLGPYRIVRELARGGMGAVHEAVHEPTGVTRALKTLLDVDPDAVLRFEVEIQALARLDHPHIVRVHEASLADQPRWLAQDLLPGGTLQAHLAGGPLPIDEAVRLGVKLAGGLQHAHERGVLHRDVKPQNVLFDELGEPRLTDFGLARCADRTTRLTVSGTLLGTPAFMAPEQASGEELDARADVYALGVVVWTLLAGRPPFGGGSLLRILDGVLREGVPPLRSVRLDIPPALESALARATALDRERRPASAAAFAAELEAALSGRAVASARARVALVGAAVLVVAMMGGIAVARWQPARPEPGIAATTSAPGSTPPPAASTSSSGSATWVEPAWVGTLRRHADEPTFTAVEAAIASGVDPRASKAALEILRGFDAGWTPPDLFDRTLDVLPPIEQLARTHALWVALDPEHRLTHEQVEALKPAFTARDAGRVARAVERLVRAAPRELVVYQLYLHGARGLPVKQRDLDLLRVGVELAESARAEDLPRMRRVYADALYEHIPKAAGPTTPEQRAAAEALAALARRVDGEHAGDAESAGVLLAGAYAVPPGEGLGLLDDALAWGGSPLRVHLARLDAFVLRDVKTQDGLARAEADAALVALEAASGGAEVTRSEIRRVCEGLFTCAQPGPEAAIVAAAASLKRALRVAGEDALPLHALRRLELLIRVQATEALADAREDALRRLHVRIGLLEVEAHAPDQVRHAKDLQARLLARGDDWAGLKADLEALDRDAATTWALERDL